MMTRETLVIGHLRTSALRQSRRAVEMEGSKFADGTSNRLAGFHSCTIIEQCVEPVENGDVLIMDCSHWNHLDSERPSLLEIFCVNKSDVIGPLEGVGMRQGG